MAILISIWQYTNGIWSKTRSKPELRSGRTAHQVLTSILHPLFWP